jgi:uncharacterized protein
MTDVQDKLGSSQAQIDETLHRFANGFSWVRRTPVLHSPSEHRLDHEDVTFPAREACSLDGWFIPCARVELADLIANHPLGFSRSGIPTHLQSWHGDWAASGNGFAVYIWQDNVVV